jgi:hypothetical protein
MSLVMMALYIMAPTLKCLGTDHSSILGKVANISVPQFSNLRNRDAINNDHVGLMRKLNKIQANDLVK